MKKLILFFGILFSIYTNAQTSKSIIVPSINYDLIAYYPLSVNGIDTTGNNPEITLQNAPFVNGSVYSDGNYQNNIINTPNITDLNLDTFKISVDFMVSERLRMPVFVCGTGGRWLGFYLNIDGTVSLLYNNSNYLPSNLNYQLNQWQNASIVNNGTTIKMYINNNFACEIDANLINPNFWDLKMGTTNYANGNVYKGYLKNIKIYGPQSTIIQTDLLVSNTRLYNTDSECYNAYNTITVAGDQTTVILENGSSANFIAGQSIRFLPGFHAQSGSSAHAYISTTFCDDLPASIVATQQIAVKSTDDVIVPNEENGFIPQASLKVFPNPNKGQFTIQLENMDSQVQLMIFNAVGTLIHQVKTSDESLIIDLSNAQRGIYFVRAFNETEQFTQKLILK